MEEHVIAERVRTAREWRGWSQQELARRAALHPVVLNRLEKKHKAGVQAETIRRLAVALQVSADYLLGLTTGTLPAPDHNADSADALEQIHAMGRATLDAARSLSFSISALPEQPAPSATRPREDVRETPTPVQPVRRADYELHDPTTHTLAPDAAPQERPKRGRGPREIRLQPDEVQDVPASTPQPTTHPRSRKAAPVD